MKKINQVIALMLFGVTLFNTSNVTPITNQESISENSELEDFKLYPLGVEPNVDNLKITSLDIPRVASSYETDNLVTDLDKVDSEIENKNKDLILVLQEDNESINTEDIENVSQKNERITKKETEQEQTTKNTDNKPKKDEQITKTETKTEKPSQISNTTTQKDEPITKTETKTEKQSQISNTTTQKKEPITKTETKETVTEKNELDISDDTETIPTQQLTKEELEELDRKYADMQKHDEEKNVDKKETNAVYPYTDEDLETFAHLIFAEAGGQSDKCKYYVGSVVLNRVKSKNYPNTLLGVIYQKGQYSPTWNGFMDKKPTKKCYDIAQELLETGSILPADVLGQAGKSVYERYGSKLYEIVDGEYFFYI